MKKRFWVKGLSTHRSAEDLVIVGNGGFAKEVKWLIDRINQREPLWNFLGFIDKIITAEGVIGDDNFVLNSHKRLAVAIGIGLPQIRQLLYKQYSQNSNVWFPNLIDPSVILSSEINIGFGNIICANNIFTVDIEMGNFNIINLSTTIGHNTKMGSYNTVNPGSNISGNVTMGSRIELGTGTKIIQGKKLESDVIVGAGAVIINDVPGRCTLVGVPAKIIKRW